MSRLLSERTRLVAAAVLAPLLLGAPPARAADLRLAGPKARTVRLIAGSGQTAVVVQNRGRRTARLRVEWTAADGSAVVALTAARPRDAMVAVEPVSALAPPLAPGAVRRLWVTLHSQPGQAPADVGGRLRFRLGRARGPAAVLSVRGAPPDLTFEPRTIRLHANLGCWLVEPVCGREETVIVRGRDAGTWALRAPGPGGSALLHDGHGASVRVALEPPLVLSDHVEVRVRASSFRRAGTFAGTLPLDPEGISGPRLAVTTDVSFALSVAVIMVFLGALFGGFFLRRFEIRRQRRLLEIELRAALHRYDNERERSPEKPASYSLDRWLDPRKRGDAADTMPFPGTRGVSALLWHIRTARDDRDFEEGTERAHDMIDRIEQWLTLEPIAREASRLLHEDLPPSRGQRRFADSDCCRDLTELRIRATRPPADEGLCEELVLAIAEQGQILAEAKILWSLMEALEQREWNPKDGATIDALDLRAIEREFGPRATRAPGQTDALRATLEQAEQRLRAMDPRITDQVTASEAVRRTVGIRDDLDDRGRNPGVAREAPEMGEWELRLRSMFHSLAIKGLFWTLVRALIASTAYTLTFYSATWGSVTDFASAFTAGFLTETLLNWASTPAFASLHLRRPARRRETPPTDAGGDELVDEAAAMIDENERTAAV